MTIALAALSMIAGFLFGWALWLVTRDKPEKAE